MRAAANNYSAFGKPATKLLDRAEVIRRKRNSMEVGSFYIDAGNILDEAWRDLP